MFSGFGENQGAAEDVPEEGRAGARGDFSGNIRENIWGGMRGDLRGGVLGLFMLASAAAPAMAAGEPPRGADFNASLSGGRVVAPIDCKALSPAGELTFAFLRQIDPGRHLDSLERGIWGGLPEGMKVKNGLRHLQSHGIVSAQVEAIRAHCIQHYSR